MVADLIGRHRELVRRADTREHQSRRRAKPAPRRNAPRDTRSRADQHVRGGREGRGVAG